MSHPPRFFINPSQVAGDRITITGEDLRHIGAVLRKKPGDRLALLDGKGAEYVVTITEMRRDEIETAIVEQRLWELKGPRIVLGQGLPKSDKMDLIVQKATELGVSSIVPLITERTIVKVRDEERRVGRWRKISREAAMQSRRADIPAVEGPRTLNSFLSILEPEPLSLFLIPWEEGTRPLKEVLRSYPAAETIVVLIGPEGGFSLNEAGAAKENGFQAVLLGPTILRTETAAIAALSMIGYEYQ
jgi:16S rRNA (uracil1498-N3)-methyltransferase